MKVLVLTDEEFSVLEKDLTLLLSMRSHEGDTQSVDSLAILNDKVRDDYELTRFSCDGSGEMSGMYEDFDRGQWFFRYDLLGYQTSDLYKVSYKYQDRYIVAETLEEAADKGANALNVQKSARHKMKVELHERGVKVDEDGSYVSDVKQHRERFS